LQNALFGSSFEKGKPLDRPPERPSFPKLAVSSGASAHEEGAMPTRTSSAEWKGTLKDRAARLTLSEKLR